MGREETAIAPPRERIARVTALDARRFEIALEGPLAPGWAGNLAAALARRGVDIERGRARGARGGLWSARFEVAARSQAIDPRALDVAALLAEDAGSGFATPLALDHFTLEASLDHGGSLHLAIRARDRVGFLAALLRRLAYFALFPIELVLDTQGACVADELWLRAGGDRAPSRSAAEALRHALRALVVARTDRETDSRA